MSHELISLGCCSLLIILPLRPTSVQPVTSSIAATIFRMFCKTHRRESIFHLLTLLHHTQRLDCGGVQGSSLLSMGLHAIMILHTDSVQGPSCFCVATLIKYSWSCSISHCLFALTMHPLRKLLINISFFLSVTPVVKGWWSLGDQTCFIGVRIKVVGMVKRDQSWLLAGDGTQTTLMLKSSRLTFSPPTLFVCQLLW